MGHTQRSDHQGAWHHVMNRGSGRRLVFANDRERQRFIDLLGVVQRRCGVETHSYCLMSNHFHLLVRSAQGALSEGMQYLSSEYTRRVNVWRDVDGPIFRGRFTSVNVESPEHLQWLVRYIHRNPVDAGLVEAVEDYTWSSLPALLGHRPRPIWLGTSSVLKWFDNRPDRLLAFVNDPVGPAEPDRVVTRGTSLPGVLDDEWKGALFDRAQMISWVSAAVGVAFACPAEIVHVARRGSLNLPRLAFFLLAVDHAGLTPIEVAQELRMPQSTVRNGLHRARERQRSDLGFGVRVVDCVLAFDELGQGAEPDSGVAS